MAGRYALYYAPPKASPLGAFGRSWLGRCAEDAVDVPQPCLGGVEPAQLRALTRAPRRYGFHATLVPPFEPAPGIGPRDIALAAGKTAKATPSFALSRLLVRTVGKFIAFVPEDQDEAAALAQGMLRALHPLRKPPGPGELERRRARGLTPEQERLLVRWGYPYVMDEYLFHMTLTGAIDNDRVRRRMLRVLSEETEVVRMGVHPVQDVSVFFQEYREAPFILAERVPLGAAGEDT